jgi:hypothetical protein
MNIELHIERLIVEGLPIAYGQRALLQAAVEIELARLLAQGGLAEGLAGGVMVPSLPAGAIQLDGVGDPASLGGRIARAVYGSIGSAGQGGGETATTARGSGQ